MTASAFPSLRDHTLLWVEAGDWLASLERSRGRNSQLKGTVLWYAFDVQLSESMERFAKG